MRLILSLLGLALACATFTATASLAVPRIGDRGAWAPIENSPVHAVSSRRDRIIGRLHADGFSDVQFQGRRLFGYVVLACRAGKRYRIAFDALTIERSRRVAGDCEPSSGAATALDDIRRRLRGEGYSQITFLDSARGRVSAEACRQGRRFVVRLDASGNPAGSRDVGRCYDAVADGKDASLPEIRQGLRDQGFRRIVFTDREPPRYEAEACRENNAFRVVMNRSGRILHETRIGSCGADNGNPVTGQDVRANLRSVGFYHIRFISRNEPPSIVEACKSGRNYRLSISREGTIEERRHLGDCKGGATLDTAALTQRLQERGYYDVRVTRENDRRIVAEACRHVRKFSVSMDRTGQILARQPIGWCSGSDRGKLVRLDSLLGHFPSARSLNPEDCDDYLTALLNRTRIHFETNSAELSSRSAELLENVGHVMKLCPNMKIEVAGHTDSKGAADYNLSLSKARARSVVNYLVRVDGVARDQLRPTGYGDTRPVARNNSERGRARNRRIEMVVIWGQ